jgi:hypothetical protein
VKRVRVLAAGLLQLLVGGLAQVGGLYAWRFLAHPAIVAALSLDEPVVTITRRLGVLVAGVLSYWAFVRLYERRPVTELRLRLGWTLVAGVAGALSIAVTIGFLFATRHAVALSWRGFATSGDVLAQIGVAAMLEELMFRALLFRILEERAGTKWALVASALFFGVAHAANGGFSAISLVSVPLCGLMWAGVYVLSRNVWVAAAHHACWNGAIFLSGLPLSGRRAGARAAREPVPGSRALEWWRLRPGGLADQRRRVRVDLRVALEAGGADGSHVPAKWRGVRRRPCAVSRRVSSAFPLQSGP